MLCNTTRRALALLPPPAVQRPLSTWAVPGFVPAIATPSHTPKLAAASIHGGDHGGVVRQHFHEFMMMVHGRLHALQASRPRIVGRSRQGLMVYRCVEVYGALGWWQLVCLPTCVMWVGIDLFVCGISGRHVAC